MNLSETPLFPHTYAKSKRELGATVPTHKFVIPTARQIFDRFICLAEYLTQVKAVTGHDRGTRKKINYRYQIFELLIVYFRFEIHLRFWDIFVDTVLNNSIKNNHITQSLQLLGLRLIKVIAHWSTSDCQ